MKNLYLGEITKDLDLTADKNLRLTDNNTEFISQKIENRFLVFLGEWFLDFTLGIPYLAIDNINRDDNTQNILVKNPDLNFINGIYLTELTEINDETELIENIISFDAEFDSANRKYSLDFKIQITGETTPLQQSLLV